MDFNTDATEITLRLPTPHKVQEIFFEWNDLFPKAQVLVAPCGTKVGKSFGAALWLLKEALVNDNLYCVWIAPTLYKCKIGYRYIKAMLPDAEWNKCVDGKLEVRLANGSFIIFLHGNDAEVTVEGEAIDRFVVDEAGKQKKQLWYSLFTTITQTNGIGIVTGTPRGFNWYHDIFRQAKKGDPFYCWAQLRTEESPYVKASAIEQAKRILPKALFDQYYRAMFVTMSTVFGDISNIWDDELKINPMTRCWIHPDLEQRKLDSFTGWDIAKHRDYTVFFTVNSIGKLVGYARFHKVSYMLQVDRLKHYLYRFFPGDRTVRYDKTGVGDAVGDIIQDKDIDASITGVIFSNKSKAEMVNRTTIAIEANWLKAPRIEQIEHEFSSYEVKVTKSGLFSYSAPDGEHDDCVSAGMLAISGAYHSSLVEETEKAMEKLMDGDNVEKDDIVEAADQFTDDDFFDEEGQENDESFEFPDMD